jgi:hypothetical protein
MGGRGHRCAGLPGTDLAAQARAWVEASCAAQGVAVKITDSEALSAVAVLLGAAPGKAGGRPAGRPLSEAPDGLEAAGIELVQAAAAGADDDVIEHSGDDGVLAGQR